MNIKEVEQGAVDKVPGRVSCKTGVVSIEPKQEPKEVSKLSETKGFVWFFQPKKNRKNRKDGKGRGK